MSVFCSWSFKRYYLKWCDFNQCSVLVAILIIAEIKQKQGRKRPLDTPERKIEIGAREREGEREWMGEDRERVNGRR